MSVSQKIAFNTLVQIISKIATVTFGLLTAVVLTSYLGRETFGDYMYVITLVVICGAFADWGTQVIGVREASRNREKQGQVLANIFLTRLFLAFSAALVMVLAAFLLPLRSEDPNLLRQGIILGSFLVILFATKASFGIVFQTKLVMQRLAAADITASALIFFLSWFFVQKQASLLTFIMAVILANALAVLIAWFLAKKTVRFKFCLDRVFIKNLVKESFPMGLVLLVFTIDNKIDTVMLGSIKGTGAVGIYAVGYRIYDVLILGAAYLMNALLPVVSKLANLNEHQEKLRQIYQKAFDVLLIMGGGAALFALTMSPLMVRVITQQRFEEFADSVLVLRILSAALFLAYFNHLIGYTIVALGRQRRYLIISLTALVFNFLANLLIIPRLSYFGAAVVTVLTEGLILIMASVLMFRLLNYAPSLTQFPKTIGELLKKKGKIF